MLAVAGPVLDEADACIARGLLQGTGDGLAFRHELAREAILAAIAPLRRRLLHARVLAALREAPGERDLALLAHHAEAAGDREAVLEFAIAAAEQAAALHAHREAAAQYARALRFADALPPAERARLLEGRSLACYMNDQGEEAIAARREALDLWRTVGDPLKEGENLRWLSHLSWVREAAPRQRRRRKPRWRCWSRLPPGPELAMAYSNLAQLRMLDHDLEGTILWGNRAIALAEQLGETETLVHALANVGSARHFAGDDRGEEELTRSLQPRPRPWVRRSRRPGPDQSGLDDALGHAARRGRSPARHRHRLRDRARSRLPTAGISWRRERPSAFARALGTRPRRRSAISSGNRCCRR